MTTKDSPKQPSPARPFAFIAYGLFFQIALALSALAAEDVVPLPGTEPLSRTGDLSAQMVAGIDKFLTRELEQSVQARAQFWQRNFSSPEAYSRAVESNRARLRAAIGAVDKPATPRLEIIATPPQGDKLAETDRYTVHAVRWDVFGQVHGEGLLLKPKRAPRACVIALPDADQPPEMIAGLVPGLPPGSQFARILAENDCEVIVPTLINRDDTWSGNEALRAFTNQPHREWIYRQAFEMGRHIIGYEVQKVLAAVRWFIAQHGAQHPPIGVFGYAEGGLLAFYSAALDPAINSAAVSGYFDARQALWQEPIYRNVFGLLQEFGDAEIASLILPRPLLIEYSAPPQIAGPPTARDRRSGAAPGMIKTPSFQSVSNEVRRANGFFTAGFAPAVNFTFGPGGNPVPVASAETISAFLKTLSIPAPAAAGAAPPSPLAAIDPAERQFKQIRELEEHTQRLLRVSDAVRDQYFWNQLKPDSTNAWRAQIKKYQREFWEDVIGRFPNQPLPLRPWTRRLESNARWTSYDVVFDLWPDVFCWGVLIVPSDLKPGERRPVVVCQHGLEGVPFDTITTDQKAGGWGAYKGFTARLAEQGFITYAPHNPYRGRDAFRVLQRKANPLKKSLFSVITAQHDRTLDWLSALPFVDPARIGFYGLSYGGKTAMRVPALLDRYCLSICSADFNDWIRKNVTTDSRYSYMFTGEYEMVEFNLGNTFNYAEMGGLIAPRPFMVERGHHDGVAPDEWVAYEFAKIRRIYAYLGIPGLTEIEFFNGPHTINGAGTFQFLHRHLQWP